MRLCRDCRWARRTLIDRMLGTWLVAKCANPAIGKEPVRIDPVTGAMEGGKWPSCSTNRAWSDGMCGKDGNLWELRQ